MGNQLVMLGDPGSPDHAAGGRPPILLPFHGTGCWRLRGFQSKAEEKGGYNNNETSVNDEL